MIRVFPRRTKWTPTDDMAFVGEPPLILPPELPVRVSCLFTWDREESLRLGRSWSRFFSDVQVGGPAFGDPGGEFTPGLFVKEGKVYTSRGCPKSCSFCLVPGREGRIRELRIKNGWDVSDNNLLACSRIHVEMVFDMLRRQAPIHFTGGLDKDLLKPWHIDLLKTIRIKRAYFACDSEFGFPALERAAGLMADFSREKKYCYVLVGDNGDTPEAAESRLIRVFNLGFMPFSMLFRGPEAGKRMHVHPAWRALIRKWCNPARYKAFMKGM